MKHLRLLLLAVLLACVAAVPSVPSRAAGATTKVFIFAGQSNADRGKLLQLPPVPSWAQTTANGWNGAPAVSSDTGITYPHPTATNAPCLYNSNNTGTLAGQVNAWGTWLNHKPKADGTAVDEDTFGQETGFIERWQHDHPGEQCAVIKVVLGGSSISDWLPGGSMSQVWPTAIQQAKDRFAAAGTPYEWSGLVWMQGESGASDYWHSFNDAPPNDFVSKTRTFFANVRSLTRTDLPVVIGRISDTMLGDHIIDGCVAQSNSYTAAQYRAATQKRMDDQVLLGHDPGCTWFSNNGFTERNDNTNPAFRYHYQDSNYVASGADRAYPGWQLLVGEVPPPPPVPLQTYVSFAGTDQPNKTAVVKLNGVAVGGDNDVLTVDVVDR